MWRFPKEVGIYEYEPDIRWSSLLLTVVNTSTIEGAHQFMLGVYSIPSGENVILMSRKSIIPVVVPLHQLGAVGITCPFAKQPRSISCIHRWKPYHLTGDIIRFPFALDDERLTYSRWPPSPPMRCRSIRLSVSVHANLLADTTTHPPQPNGTDVLG